MAKYNARIGGVNLGDFQGVIVQSITEEAPAYSLTTAANPKGFGGHVMGSQRTALNVNISFSIKERRYERRAQIFAEIMQWARSGDYLQVNYRTAQQLHIAVASFPAAGAMSDWNATYTIKFTGIVCPYWEATSVQTVVISGGSGGFADYVYAEKVDTVAEAELQITAAITELTVSNELTEDFIHLTGFTTDTGKAGNLVYIKYDESGYLRLSLVDGETDEEFDCYRYRTADSSDDIRITAGTNRLTISSNGGVSGDLLIRRRYE